MSIEAREIALENVFAMRHEDFSFDPRNWCKKLGSATCACERSMGEGVETSRSLGLTAQ